MSGSTNPELVAAVCNAGGLGSFGAAGTKPERLHAVVEAIRERTDCPFNVNIFSADTERFDRSISPGPRLMRRLEEYHAEMGLGEIPEPSAMFGPAEEQLEVLLEHKVPIISFHFGVEPSVVEKSRRSGAKVLCTATTVAEARVLEEAGVDAVIAQGSEAGGHRGTFDGDYRQALIGALALGASAVQMGTAFLACPEAPVAGAWREALLRAEADATVVTEAMSGKPARGIPNRYVRKIEALDETLPPYSAQYSLSRELRKAASERDNPEFMAMWSGQGVGLIRRQPAPELVATLVRESRRIMERFTGQ